MARLSDWRLRLFVISLPACEKGGQVPIKKVFGPYKLVPTADNLATLKAEWKKANPSSPPLQSEIIGGEIFLKGVSFSEELWVKFLSDKKTFLGNKKKRTDRERTRATKAEQNEWHCEKNGPPKKGG